MVAHSRRGLDIPLEGQQSRTSDHVVWAKRSFTVDRQSIAMLAQLETVVKISIVISSGRQRQYEPPSQHIPPPLHSPVRPPLLAIRQRLLHAGNQCSTTSYFLGAAVPAKSVHFHTVTLAASPGWSFTSEGKDAVGLNHFIYDGRRLHIVSATWDTYMEVLVGRESLPRSERNQGRSEINFQHRIRRILCSARRMHVKHRHVSMA